jgi:hypothetical protein
LKLGVAAPQKLPIMPLHRQGTTQQQRGVNKSERIKNDDDRENKRLTSNEESVIYATSS